MSDWKLDAELAGTLYRKSKPYTAMLIARCVEHGEPGKPRQNAAKCSIREFVDRGGLSNNTVAKYLRTWDLMAEFGEVPSRDDMEPGEDVKLPDMSVWTKYYREANPAKNNPEKEPDAPKAIDPSNRRVATAIKMASGIKVNGRHEITMNRITEAVKDIGFGANPGRAYVALASALSDLAAEMNE